ncbi:MAG: bifunctional (p)ppGpp synthetase/guanosine-3',5'-bis(diphosphate) 3'-pyrophosphohydrolase [Pseudomonadota bacterium]
MADTTGSLPPTTNLDAHKPDASPSTVAAHPHERSGDPHEEDPAPPTTAQIEETTGLSPENHADPAAGAAANPEPASVAHKTAPETAPVGFIRQYELVDLVKAYDPDADEDLLNKAYVVAMRAHGGQTRKSGDPYFTHPLAVAGILTELRADPASVATALLHDVVEDTDVTIDEIREMFGDEIAQLVDGVTKLSQIELRSSDASKQAENFRKLVMAMAEDVRVLLVKLADRLHNMRTLEFFDNEQKKRRIALETMEIYAPLAGRIGVQRFREELEELSFRVLNPEAYDLIRHRLDDLQSSIVHYVVELAQVLRERLQEAGIDADVHSREKRPYSIWRKMSAKNVSFDELADIYGFRVLTNDLSSCYEALGVIHTTWRMIPSEFDDYISATKPNNYQSIHTAVIGPPRSDGGRQRIEIQIRTREMHETAERGVAAHWQYKDNPKKRTSVEIITPGFYDPYETPRRLVEMFQQGDDPDESLKYAKLELFQDQVFCFTPKGRVIALPRGATILDFAYAVHTDVGDTCIGGKINGAARPLRTPLTNGDVVLVLRSETSAPPADWESMVVTGRARAAIRRRIKKMKHTEHVELGRSIAEKVFQDVNLDLTPKAIKAGLLRLSEETVDDVFAKVGRGDLSVAELVDAVYPGVSLETEGEIHAASAPSLRPRAAIDGLPPKVEIVMGPCCTPVPGERIVGIRNADKITVHAITCQKLAEDDPPQDKWLDLRWREDRELAASSQIRLTVHNENGVLSDVAGVIARYDVSIANIRLENQSADFVDLFVDVVINDAKQLTQMLAGVRASASVVSAERVEGSTA